MQRCIFSQFINLLHYVIINDHGILEEFSPGNDPVPNGSNFVVFLNNPQVDQLVQQIGNRRPVVWERLFFFADLAIAVLNLGVTHVHPDPFDVSFCNNFFTWHVEQLELNS